MKKYFVALYQIVKDTQKVRNKIQFGDIRTYYISNLYRGFNIDAFAIDPSGRKLIGFYYDKFSEKEWTLRDRQVHLFCKTVAVIGTFLESEAGFEELFADKKKDSCVLRKLKQQLYDYDRLILSESHEVLAFGVNSGNDKLIKAFNSKKFSAKDGLPKDSFIIIDIEEPEF